MPNHQYARLRQSNLRSIVEKVTQRTYLYHETMRDYTASTRAYSRVVLRLRVQAEAAEAEYMANA